MIERYSPEEPAGIHDYSLLESAVLRPQSSAFAQDAYPSLFDKAAALFHSLAMNHPFQNANKRTAFTAMVVFLQLNRMSFQMAPRQAEEFVVSAVNPILPFEELARIIEQHSAPRLPE
ncbi:type II toxin-antitoxin system death-on-curing family toxin [Gorillibacterium sp. sgz500922]|uniref:type II toxin-antitoxin system death-on-curing family toxin n=1 Tax=Gorillibacterium sp. sgz500922 TaxID=3446694 RepID=UPI003F669EBF